MKLFRFERRWLLLVFDTVVPSGADERLPFGASDAPMDRFIDDLMDRAPFQFCIGLRVCLWVVMLSPLFLIGHIATFAGLSPVDRARLLTVMGESDRYLIREMPLLFKTVACLGFCGLPEVQRRVGITVVDRSLPEWARGGSGGALAPPSAASAVREGSS